MVLKAEPPPGEKEMVQSVPRARPWFKNLVKVYIKGGKSVLVREPLFTGLNSSPVVFMKEVKVMRRTM